MSDVPRASHPLLHPHHLDLPLNLTDDRPIDFDLNHSHLNFAIAEARCQHFETDQGLGHPHLPLESLGFGQGGVAIVT